MSDLFGVMLVVFALLLLQLGAVDEALDHGFLLRKRDGVAVEASDAMDGSMRRGLDDDGVLVFAGLHVVVVIDEDRVIVFIGLELNLDRGGNHVAELLLSEASS